MGLARTRAESDPSQRGPKVGPSLAKAAGSLPVVEVSSGQGLDHTDALRGLALLLMVETHFLQNLSAHLGSWGSPYAGVAMVGRWAEPLFAVLFGIFLSSSFARQGERGATEEEIDRYVVRVGLFLFALGMAVSSLIWLPRQALDWDYLTLLGSSTLVLAGLRRLPLKVLAGLCAVLVVVSPPLRDLSGYAWHWNDEEYFYNLNRLGDMSWGLVLNGYFPLLPWLVFPLVGYALAEQSRQRPGRRWPNDLLFWGLALSALAGLGALFQTSAPDWVNRYYATGYTLYPASTVYVLGTLGMTLVTLWAVQRWMDRPRRIGGWPWGRRFLRRFSDFSWTVYVGHHAAHLWPLWIFGAVEGKKNVAYYEGRLVSAPVALCLGLAVIVLFGFALVWLERRPRWSLEHVMRWLCE
jgi:uncharacterized membrane protein